jgi:hypothetical protein
LTFVAGSSPVGHAPAYPPSSSTVIEPPALGVPDAVVDEADEVELDPAAADEAEELDLELPHALTTAAIRNRQAATAASLRKRMA